MTSLILNMSVSLDGYVAPADGSSDWEAAGRSPDGAEWVLDTVSNAAAHLVGAVTYERWAGLWPGASGPFAAPMNEIPKVVFSNSLTSADWGETTIATGDLVDAVARKQQPCAHPTEPPPLRRSLVAPVMEPVSEERPAPARTRARSLGSSKGPWCPRVRLSLTRYRPS
jgi:RibD C-terminal domain